jgi:hypothetical protein
MRQGFAGAVLLVAGIAAFIEAHSHPAELESRCRKGGTACPLEDFMNVHIGLSQTAYDPRRRVGAGDRWRAARDHRTDQLLARPGAIPALRLRRRA